MRTALLACGDGATTPSPVVDTDFEIEIVFINHGTPSQDAAFQSAADRWMQILDADLTDVSFSTSPVRANTCVQGQAEVSDTVDDLRIFVDITPIDGILGTLGQAGSCQIRSGSRGLGHRE